MIRATATASLFLLLAACQTKVIDTSCVAFKPISFSAKNDTEQTIREVREHNGAWDKLCGKG